MIELPWSEFKTQILDDSKWQWIFFDINNHYYIYGKQSDFTVLCKVYKDGGADQLAFEADYKETVRPPFVNRTEGRFERDDIVLKLAQMSGQADANGDLVLSFQLPGERYVAGGYAFTDNYQWGDKVTKVEVVDDDNLLGYGVGAVVKEYHESETSNDKQGWPFWKTFGTEGECEIEPMGWYGHIPLPLYLKITLKIAANANVKIALWQGKVE